ncbi:hypothetical protein X975_14226, partial [Stegodyphus mimosarum]
MAEDSIYDIKLIDEVRQQPVLWDNRTKSYRLKTGQSAAWILIASRLNRNVQDVVYRWQNLRRKYIRRKTKSRRGEPVKDWHLTSQMSFLAPCVHSRNVMRSNSKHNESDFTTLNLKIESVNSISSDGIEIGRTESTDMPPYVHMSSTVSLPKLPDGEIPSSLETDTESLGSTPEHENTSGGKRGEKKDETESSSPLVNTEVNNLEKQEKCENSLTELEGDKLFLLSLLTDLNAIPREKKLQ